MLFRIFCMLVVKVRNLPARLSRTPDVVFSFADVAVADVPRSEMASAVLLRPFSACLLSAVIVTLISLLLAIFCLLPLAFKSCKEVLAFFRAFFLALFLNERLHERFRLRWTFQVWGNDIRHPVRRLPASRLPYVIGGVYHVIELEDRKLFKLPRSQPQFSVSKGFGLVVPGRHRYTAITLAH